MIRYLIDASHTASHTFAVELRIARPARAQRLSLPVWIPGSYLVREFARHLSALTAEQDGEAVPLEQLDKASWIAHCTGDGELVLRYRVYAFDLSVRAAFLDADRGFFNGTGVCLRVEGREGEPHRLALAGLAPGWHVATTLLPQGDAAAHEYVAADYDELVDHPVELGRFWRGSFTAAGVAHELVVAGAFPDFDGAALLADAKRICETEIAFWHGPGGKAPFDRYLFLLNAIDEGRGGLEHRASTALVAPRRNLPRRGAGVASARAAEGAAAARVEPSEGYTDLLGLISHEYFHAWNVKRLKPREFRRLDYAQENYTRLLWFFEGFTSYYDDLLLLRSGLIDAAHYLRLVAKTMTTVAGMPGRGLQSVAAASFDAWVKYYRGDENTPNATVSYYAKGSLVALAFDLTLRSEGRGSLDGVMRWLWSKSEGGPVDEGDIAAALEAVGGRSYAAELAAWVHGTGELPLAELLARFGIGVEHQPATLAQRLGVRVSESALTGVKVTHVLRGGAGQRIGLAAGDELIGVGAWRLRRLDDALRFLAPAGATPLRVARDQRLLDLELDIGLLAGEESGAVQLRRGEDASAEARARVEAWTSG
jgi:predicted metalloprotease with PDZ domain